MKTSTVIAFFIGIALFAAAGYLYYRELGFLERAESSEGTVMA